MIAFVLAQRGGSAAQIVNRCLGFAMFGHCGRHLRGRSKRGPSGLHELERSERALFLDMNQSELERHEDASLHLRQLVRIVVDELEELSGEQLLRASPALLGPVSECCRLGCCERSSTLVEACEISVR